MWDVWVMTSLLSAVLLTVGGWLQAGLIGAVAGALVGGAVGAVTVSHNETAKAALYDTVFTRVRHRRHHQG